MEINSLEHKSLKENLSHQSKKISNLIKNLKNTHSSEFESQCKIEINNL